MVEGNGVGQHAVGPNGAKGQQRQAQMGCQYQTHNHENYDPGKKLLPGSHPALGQPAAAFLDRRILLALQGQHGQPHGGQGDHHQKDRDHIAHGVLDADGSDSKVGLGCQHVIHVQQQRCTEVIENFQKYQRGTCHVPRHGQRQYDPAE